MVSAMIDCKDLSHTKFQSIMSLLEFVWFLSIILTFNLSEQNRFIHPDRRTKPQGESKINPSLF